jgi:PTS system nitrogen regulatory IIA component
MADLMTVRQAAEYLQLHEETITLKARRGELPAAKIGRQWRLRKVDLDDWISRGGTRQPHEQTRLAV